MKASKKPIALVGAILLALSALLSLDNLVSISKLINWLQQPDNPFVVSIVFDLISSVVLTFGSLGPSIWAFTSKDLKPLAIPSLALLLLGPLIALGVDVFWLTQGNSFADAFFQTYGGPARIAAAVAVFTALIGAALLSIGARTANANTSSPAIGENRFDPETGLPVASAQVAQPVATGGADSSLPMVALILAFFIPLGAVIVGHIAMNQMNQGLISSQNRGMAKAGLILGYVFIGLSMLLGLIFGIVYFAMLQRAYY